MSKKEIDEDGFDDLVDRIYVVKKFRSKLAARGQSLKWWHRNHALEMCTRAYFIKQLNDVESMQEKLWKAIREYVG